MTPRVVRSRRSARQAEHRIPRRGGPVAVRRAGAGAERERADGERAGLSGEPAAAQDAAVEPDPPAEEDFGIARVTELEEAGAFEEELALLREEQVRKRVRLIWTLSDSTCAKSVFQVRSSVRFGVTRYLRSAPAFPCASNPVSPAGCCAPSEP